MKYPVETRQYMRKMLTIKVRYEASGMKCTVSYGLWSIELPEHIDELWSGIRGVSDYTEARRLYKIITMEVNDMLREYCSKNDLTFEQFGFQAAPTNDLITMGIANTINIVGGGTPRLSRLEPETEARVYRNDRATPQMEYISAEEYERKRANGELRTGTIYCVLN